MPPRPKRRFWRICRIYFRRVRITVWLVVLALVCSLLYLNRVGLPGKRSAAGGLSVALRKSGEFPPMVLRMVSAGESSGNLDATLDNVAAYYDREVPAIVKKTFAILEPAMTILLALVVLGAALSFFLALYKMVGSMGAGR